MSTALPYGSQFVKRCFEGRSKPLEDVLQSWPSVSICVLCQHQRHSRVVKPAWYGAGRSQLLPAARCTAIYKICSACAKPSDKGKCGNTRPTTCISRVA
eukprot:1513036-Amphidinium_carterae.1